MTPDFIGIHIVDAMAVTAEEFDEMFEVTIAHGGAAGGREVRAALEISEDTHVKVHAFYTAYARGVWLRSLPEYKDGD